MYTLPALPLKVRPLNDEQSKWIAENHPSAVKSPKDCITCSGKKTFQWYVPGSREEVGDYECSCDDQFILHRAFLYAGIGLSYQRIAWLDFFDMKEHQEKAASDYLDRFEGFVSNGIGMILTGDKGAGKTMYASLLLKELMAEGFSGRYTTMAEMIDTFAGGWKSQSAKAWFDKQVRNVDVLVVDDIGRERKHGKESGVDTEVRTLAVSTTEEVLRHRVQHSKPTFFTTNLTMEEIRKGYGGSSMSLLVERSIVVPFRGKDERVRVKDRNVSDIIKGLARPIVVN